MKATTEMEIKVSGARILEAFVEPNGSCKLIVEAADVPKDVTADKVTETKETATSKAEIQFKEEHDDNIFVLVEASKLSVEDDFMSHEPTTDAEEELKKLLTDAIKSGLHDFYRPVLDPSFNEDGGICYAQGKRPAVGKSYNWWKKAAEEFMPERGSRLGTKVEYVAFLGVLLKNMVNNGWSKAQAWSAVCNDSRELGHYWNSENAKHEFEPTGSRKIVSYYDLANTFKILAEDEEAGGFWLAGGNYGNDGDYCPLADLDHFYFRVDDVNFGVGWLVLKK